MGHAKSQLVDVVAGVEILVRAQKLLRFPGRMLERVAPVVLLRPAPERPMVAHPLPFAMWQLEHPSLEELREPSTQPRRPHRLETLVEHPQAHQHLVVVGHNAFRIALLAAVVPIRPCRVGCPLRRLPIPSVAELQAHGALHRCLAWAGLGRREAAGGARPGAARGRWRPSGLRPRTPERLQTGRQLIRIITTTITITITIARTLTLTDRCFAYACRC